VTVVNLRVHPYIAAAWLLVSCGWLRGEAEKPDTTERKPRTDEKPATKAEAGRRSPEDIPRDKPETVVFIVMDTVRADHLSLCGYDRPTSPYLVHLRDELGVAVTCDAYSPATWTMPSHTSYFTGRTVPEHHHDRLGAKLDPAAGPFLSEIMHDKGYTSLMFAANTALKKSGLQRGFDKVRIAEDMAELRAGPFETELDAFLTTADKSKPWFLFVNLIDAHDPYPEVPEGVPWVPAQKSLAFNVRNGAPETDYHHYLRGTLQGEAAKGYLTSVTNGYDYGVSQEDENVRAVFQVLRKLGRLPGPLRLVITADHGEFLGEHELLRHAAYVWEPVVHVPFLYFDNLAAQQITLPAPFAAMSAFWLVRDGKLPEAPLPVQSWSRVMDDRPIKPGEDMMAQWSANNPKLLWRNGAFSTYNLTTDPSEAQPGDATGHPLRPGFDNDVKLFQQHLQTTGGMPLDPETVEALQKLGYLH
jgi:hypothetical protein